MYKSHCCLSVHHTYSGSQEEYPQDIGLYFLTCTEKAQQILKAGLEMQQDFNQKLTLDIPQKYMNIFKEITDSMAVNARQMLNK